MNAIVKFFATGFFTGYSPIMPGTAGSAAAILIAWLVPLASWHILLLFFAGVWLCGRAEGLFSEHDSPKIVFDEFCGIFIATWQLQHGYFYLIAFILFRFFDILKPNPINRLQDLPGGWGIMADDIAAGIIVRMLLFLVGYL